MKYTEPGTYKIQYTAEDGCGKTTVEDRTVIVTEPPTYRTVLYTDGTFIINESSVDEASNVSKHGEATKVYEPMLEDGSNYVFNYANDRPWDNPAAGTQKDNILHVEVGTLIKPISTAYWFYGLRNATSFDLDNLDTSLVTSMEYMFTTCNIDSINLSSLDTSSVENMRRMFQGITATVTVDLSSFDTSKVTNMEGMFLTSSSAASPPQIIDLSSFDTSMVLDMSSMFRNNGKLTTVLASDKFVTQQVTSSSNMFDSTSRLVGGAGTTYNSSYKDKTYARIDNPPDAPGYFTAKE